MSRNEMEKQQFFLHISMFKTTTKTKNFPGKHGNFPPKKKIMKNFFFYFYFIHVDIITGGWFD